MDKFNYTTEDVVRLEARIYALERYIQEHAPEGGWFLDQEYHKYLSVVASRHGDVEMIDRMMKERLAHEEHCREQDIEVKYP